MFFVEGVGLDKDVIRKPNGKVQFIKEGLVSRRLHSALPSPTFFYESVLMIYNVNTSFLTEKQINLLTLIKIRKTIKIGNRYNQVPHLTRYTNGKVTNSQFEITNESKEVSPFRAGGHKAYYPSVHFMGHRQTVKKQIRRRKTRRLIRLITVCFQNILLQVEWLYKVLSNNPKT